MRDYEQFKNVTDLFSIVTVAMPIEFRMKICLFREQSEKQSAKWNRGFKTSVTVHGLIWKKR